MALEKLANSLNPQRLQETKVNRYVSTPEQLLALRIAQELGDADHKDIYLHLCKYTQTALIEQALRFVADANARSKGKLFSWKVKQLRQEWLSKGKNPNREVIPKRVKPKKGSQPDLFSV